MIQYEGASERVRRDASEFSVISDRHLIITLHMPNAPELFPITTEHWASADDDADEARWDALFAATQDELSLVADKILGDIEAGRTRPLDPDQM
ncbi:MAG TPA: hypothetical protein VLA19_29810 [Herpetosiphonaceae bacterium]|nr:hypothetical protein [Herpetosiphonaceae bacterium]